MVHLPDLDATGLESIFFRHACWLMPHRGGLNNYGKIEISSNSQAHVYDEE